MRIQITLVLFVCLTMVGCRKKFINTAKVCDGKFFVEIYDVNVAGVYCHYLTDSSKFRVFIGKFDAEHENFTYSCHGDSLIVNKVSVIDTTGKMNAVETKIYSISKLKSDSKFD